MSSQITETNMNTTPVTNPVSKKDVAHAYKTLVMLYRENFNPLHIKVALSLGLKTNEIIKLFAPENSDEWFDCADFRGSLSQMLNCRNTDIRPIFREICKEVSTEEMLAAYSNGFIEFLEYIEEKQKFLEYIEEKH